MSLNKHVLSIFLISLMVSSILINVSTTAESSNKGPKTKVYIYPRRVAYPKLDIGDEFKVDVRVDNIDNIYGYEFKLNYNPEVLEYVGIKSSFLNQPTFRFKKSYGTGVVWLATASMYPAEAKTEDGVLATITFRVVGRGLSILDLYKTKLLNFDVERVSHTVKDGYFRNGPDSGEEIEILEEEVPGTFEESYIEESGVAQTTEFTEMTYSTESPLKGCDDEDCDDYSPDGGNCGPIDCDDGNPLTYPGSTEICDRKDNNCDGHKDEPDVCCSGDINHKIESGYYHVGLDDLVILGKAYGSKAGEERYDECVNASKGSYGWYCDIYGFGGISDGIINVFDLAWVGKNYGKSCLACVTVTIHVQEYDGTPIDEAPVYIYKPDFTLVDSGLTDSSGNYETCREDGEYIVRAWLPDASDKRDVLLLVPDDTYVLVEF